MVCVVPKNIYLKVLDVCKKARLLIVNDINVIIEFDDEELKNKELVKTLEKIFKEVGF